MRLCCQQQETHGVFRFMWLDGKAKKPENPTKKGYIFAGYHNGRKTYNFSTAVTKFLWNIQSGIHLQILFFI